MDPEEEQKEDKRRTKVGALKRKENWRTMKQTDPWSPLRKKVGKVIEESYMKQVQRFMDKVKNQIYAEDAAFNTL